MLVKPSLVYSTSSRMNWIWPSWRNSCQPREASFSSLVPWLTFIAPSCFCTSSNAASNFSPGVCSATSWIDTASLLLPLASTGAWIGITYWRSPSVRIACTTYRSFGLTSAGLKVSLNGCGKLPAGAVLVASGAEPTALEETSTRFNTRVALSEGCAVPSRREIVPLTSLGIDTLAALSALAGPPLAA